MHDGIKHGSLEILEWSLGRDLTGATIARVKIRSEEGGALAVDRNGAFVDPRTTGRVTLQLEAGDFAAGKLDTAEPAGLWYDVEVHVEPGPLKHPSVGRVRLLVEPALG